MYRKYQNNKYCVYIYVFIFNNISIFAQNCFKIIALKLKTITVHHTV